MARLYHGDCLEIMPTLEAGSVDLVLCDLPYETVNWASPHAWDKALPMAELWRCYWPLLKSKGAVLLFGNEPFSTMVRASALEFYKYDLYWIKSKKGGFANAKVKPLKAVETISVFSRGTTSPGRSNNMVYNPQGLTAYNKTVKNSGKSRLGMTVRENAKREYTQEWTNYPDDVLQFNSVAKTDHPTQKPVDLVEYLIRTYTNVGDVVLDNTMGSGTTGVAAARCGRAFIGIEKDAEYFRIAKERIDGVGW